MRRTEDLDRVRPTARVRYIKAMIAAEEALQQADALKQARPRHSTAITSALPPAPRLHRRGRSLSPVV